MKFHFFGLKRKNFKIGLALGGGGARGFAHIGVIKALEEEGISFDFVAGTSAGSFVGALYCAGFSAQQMIDMAHTFSLKEIKTSKIPLVPNKTEALEGVVNDFLHGVNFAQLKIPFCAVAVDIRSGNEIHVTKGNVAKAVSASCAAPGFFTPVALDSYLLFDGGLSNNIPSNVPKLFGCDAVIAVDINSTRGQGTTSDKYIDLLISSMSIMMKSNSLKGYLNADVMIQPNMKRFRSTKIIDLDDMVDEGYKATKNKIEEIKRVLHLKKSRKKTPKPTNKVSKKIKHLV